MCLGPSRWIRGLAVGLERAGAQGGADRYRGPIVRLAYWVRHCAVGSDIQEC